MKKMSAPTIYKYYFNYSKEIMTSALQKIETMPIEFTHDKVNLLKQTVCKGSSDNEFELFLHVCKRTGLDPFMKQIYSIPRGGQRTIQTAIDGFRLIAERTGRYAPGKESTYVYDDKGNLFSATSYVKKMTPDGTWHEISASAIFNEYCPGNGTFWKKMPHVMLAKCAEAIALRKAFPAELAGIYSKEEMAQAEKGDEEEISLIEEPQDFTESLKARKKEIMSLLNQEEMPLFIKYVEQLKSTYKSKKEHEFFLPIEAKIFVDNFNTWKSKQKGT